MAEEEGVPRSGYDRLAAATGTLGALVDGPSSSLELEPLSCFAELDGYRLKHD